MVSWTKKYAPQRRSEIVGNEESVNSIIAYLNKFRNPRLRQHLRKKALLLHGPPGIGKTSSVIAIAKALKFDFVVVNASDKRNKKALQSVRNASQFSSLQENLDSDIIGQILLIDEVDGLSGSADRGGLREIVEIINSTRVPIILTANDVSTQKYTTLRKYCELRKFSPPTSQDITKILRRISKAESLTVSDDVLHQLIEINQFDIRGSINSLQTLATGRKEILKEDLEILAYRDKSIQFREFLETLWIEGDGVKAYQETRMLSDVDYGKILLLLRDFSASFIIQDNYNQLARVYELLAAADVALARAQRERIWSQLAYFYSYISKELARVITPISNLPNIQDWQLQVPSYWIILSRQKKGKNIGLKIGRVCKVSSQEAINYFFPYLRVIFNQNIEMAADLAIDFNLFNIEPGKRKTRIIWNGEIDFFSKNKNINREIKKQIRNRYPEVQRIREKEANHQEIEIIQVDTRRKSLQKKPKKNKKLSEGSTEPIIKNLKKSDENKKPNRGKKKASRKSLSDFF